MLSLIQLDFIILFFILGMFASWIRSDLEVPESISKFLSIFLLLSLGLKGGYEISNAGDLNGFSTALFLGISSCIVIPSYLFWLLKSKLGSENSAALSASYGSVSAITFVAARAYLENEQIYDHGYMVAVMALMEIPAIILALIFFQNTQTESNGKVISIPKIMRVFSKSSVVLLIGGFLIGLCMDTVAWVTIKPVVSDSFKGVLIFFLLDLGIAAQRQLKNAWKNKQTALLVALILPVLHGLTMLFLAHLFGLPQGDQVLLAVLAGSASYIAAPALIRSSIPNANPSFYVALPLALTFPFNVIVGIPFYIEMSRILGSL